VLPDGQVYTTQSTQDISAVMLQQLGLVLSPTVTALPASETPGKAVVSQEQLGVLDADVVILTYFSEDSRTAFEGNSLFQQLPAVRRGAYINLTNDAWSQVVGATPALSSGVSLGAGKPCHRGGQQRGAEGDDEDDL
jgi:iron complex transport system substrate-binding protein